MKDHENTQGPRPPQEHDELWGDLDEAPIRPHFLTFDEVVGLDFASMPAALCWASYSTNNWAMDLAAGVVDPAAWMGEEQRSKGKADDVPRALLIANACHPLEAAEIGIEPARHAATLGRGVWTHGRVGRALVCVERKGDGEKTLHLCIRGTDFDNHPHKVRSIVRAISEYFIRFYFRIEEFAVGFEPLAEALSGYASNPKNGVSAVVLSGHSLGGAAAQTLMHSFTGCSAEVHLVTFGSPGSGSGWLAPLYYLLRLLRKGTRLCLSALSRLTWWWGWLSKLLGEAASSFEASLPAKIGNRLHFKHPGDPIARYPAMIYRTAGSEVVALSSLEIPTDGGRKINLRVKGLGAHACSQYFKRIHDMLDRALEDVAPYLEPTMARKRLMAARESACRLEDQTPPAQMNNRVAIARQSNRFALARQPHSEEAIKRLAKLPPPRASSAKIRSARELRRLAMHMDRSG